MINERESVRELSGRKGGWWLEKMRHKETAARTESTFLRLTAATITALTGSVTHTVANEETVHS